MAHLENSERRRRARLAYERGRLGQAVTTALPFAAIGAVAGAPNGLHTAAVGAVLVFVVAVLALVRGEDIARAVVPGAVAGAVPVALVTISMRYAHVCVGASCTSVCLAACGVGGAAAAIVVHLHARRAERPRQAWLGGLSVATSMGVLACTCLGSLGVAALAAGLALGLVARAASPAYAAR